MKRILIAGIIVLLLLATVGLAYPGFAPYGGCHSYGSGYQTEIKQIMASGSFEDIEALRENTGYNIMPWVNDEESFKLMHCRNVPVEDKQGSAGKGS